MAATKTKNEKKKSHPMRRFFSVLMIMIACLLTYVSAQELVTTVQLKQELAKAQSDEEELGIQEEALEKQKLQFEDEEYVKQYARGKYLYSKEGEIVYKFPENYSGDNK